MENIEIFEHTADVGIRLKRPSREELFHDAAMGMFYIIAPENKFLPHIEYSITVVGADDEELMVNWLSELNFYFQTVLYVPVEIKLEVFDHRLDAHIYGDVIDQTTHNVEIEIKAVTYHKIYVRREHDLWAAQIIFDI